MKIEPINRENVHVGDIYIGNQEFQGEYTPAKVIEVESERFKIRYLLTEQGRYVYFEDSNEGILIRKKSRGLEARMSEEKVKVLKGRLEFLRKLNKQDGGSIS